MPRRRHVLAGLASLPLIGKALAILPTRAEERAEMQGDKIAAGPADIIVHPVEHASLVLGFGPHILYVDPVGGAELYQGLPAPTAILITHGHGDHFDVPTLNAIAGAAPILSNAEVFNKLPAPLRAQATALANGETAAIDGVSVSAIPAHNITPERLRYHPEGVGNGYVFTLGDKRVYIAGDTEPTPAMLGLTGIGLAFLPMNLPYTMTPQEAAAAVNVFRPAIVYPYHYKESELSLFADAVGPQTEVRLRDWYPRGAGNA
ncbi:MAG: hypothetical protein ABS76_11950 [Pelagibacterium sp. SCN 64-44]|nr:MAG: hypothetical protein ABS76_11950 [Pelagibacterium sp. SCN 64-44]